MAKVRYASDYHRLYRTTLKKGKKYNNDKRGSKYRQLDYCWNKRKDPIMDILHGRKCMRFEQISFYLVYGQGQTMFLDMLIVLVGSRKPRLGLAEDSRISDF